MNKDYWFPWAPTKFRKYTMHLNDDQELIYRRLIDFYMETAGGLPDNDQALANIARVSLEKWLANAEVIRAFFAKATGKLQLKECDGILADQAHRKKVKSENGKKGGRGKSNKNNVPKATAKLNDGTLHYTTGQVVDDADANAPSILPHIPLTQRLAPIIGFDSTDPKWFGSFSRVQTWLANGWDAELDIVPTVARVMGNRDEPPRSLNYFDQAIADAYATRMKPLPQGKPNGTNSQKLSKSERLRIAGEQALAEIGAAADGRPEVPAIAGTAEAELRYLQRLREGTGGSEEHASRLLTGPEPPPD